MIVITNIDTIETDRDPAYIQDIGNGVFSVSDSRWNPIQGENIKGRIFTNQRSGQEYIISSLAKNADVLGFYCESFSDLISDIHKLNKASLWTRIKWVFTGVKNESTN